MSTVFIVRAARDIAVAPPWNADIVIPKGELLLARPAGAGEPWRLFPFPGVERDWHPFVRNKPEGLGVRGDVVQVLLPLTPPPPVSARKELSPSSWVVANHSACVWFLERHEAITALLDGISETAGKEENS